MDKTFSLIDAITRRHLDAARPDHVYSAARMSLEELLCSSNSNDAVAAQILAKTPRYFLSKQVVTAFQKMHNNLREDATYFERTRRIIISRPELVLPPFLKTWIEFEYPDPLTDQSKRVGLKVTNLQKWLALVQKRSLSNYQQIIGDADGPIFQKGITETSFFEYANGIIRPDKGYSHTVILRRDGEIDIFGSTINGMAYGDHDYNHQEMPEAIKTMVAFAIAPLMMLKSRNSLLKVVEPSLSSLKKDMVQRKVAAGKFVEQPFYTIEFDLSREFRRDPNQTPHQAAAAIEEHIVSGHFKLRESGLFWWSPFWRCGTEGQKAVRKDRVAMYPRRDETVLRRPANLIIPGMQLF